MKDCDVILLGEDVTLSRTDITFFGDDEKDVILAGDDEDDVAFLGDGVTLARDGENDVNLLVGDIIALVNDVDGVLFPGDDGCISLDEIVFPTGESVR